MSKVKKTTKNTGNKSVDNHTTKTKFCVIYCRVSSVNQSKYMEGHTSLETQEQVCRDYAEKFGYIVKNVYSDVCSGRNMDKQYGLKKMIRNVYSGNTILFYEASRFSRNTLQALSCLDKLKKKGIYIYSISDDCGYSSNSDKYKFRLLFPKAENESDMISERVRKSVLFRRKRGDYIGNAPYGYETYLNDQGIRKLRKNKDEQFVIQFICKMIHDNKTYCEIAEKLNEIKIDKRGYTWTNNSVSSVVKSNIKKTFVGFSKSMNKSLDEAVIDDDNDSMGPPAKKKKKYNFRK